MSTKKNIRSAKRMGNQRRSRAKAIEDDAVKPDASFESLYLHGSRLLQHGRTAEAQELLMRAHQLDPEHIDAGLNLSGSLILNKRFKKAVEILEPLRDLSPENAELWINLGAAYLGNPVLARPEDQDRALEAFKHALEIKPAAPSVAYNIGLIYRDRRERDQAIYWFRQAISHNSQDKDAFSLLSKLEVEGNSK